jgi:Na+-transporting methylmalonyl-CoA/oxaloacetate decarboxylase gamma subunit
MRGRLRRQPASREHAADEGPFVSFTDLFIGILFLFLILVAALMLMHQEAVRREKAEAQLVAERLAQMQAKVDAAAKKEAEHPGFRLGIVFNIYQRPAVVNAEWTFSRTVQVFRAPNGLCINNVILRSNLSTAWKPPVGEEDIPTAGQQELIRKIEACGITGSYDRWNLPSETGNLRRVSPDLYSGAAVLHKQGGDVRIEMQYRVLGVYDDYFR